ncbi:MAG: ABC transporter permease [Armatimonadota bacterium]|nr:ABC transporter permease [Armatimonadota bacterium]
MPQDLGRAVRLRGRTDIIFRRFAANRLALAGLVALGLLLLATVAAPLLTPHSYARINPLKALQPPSSEHPFGNDRFGRDVLARVLYGGRTSLLVGLLATAVGAGIGVPAGLVSGGIGGLVDTVLMRVVDVMLAFPGLLLAIGIVAVLGTSLTNLMIAVGIGSVPGFARVVRGSVLAAREYEYVLAARAIGCGESKTMFRHILPNVMAPIIVLATLNIANAILAGSTLNFLGMGAKPPSPEWGLMLADGRDTLTRAWWVSVFPGLAIMVATMSINFVGDGLRQALDPRMKIP